MSYEQTFWVMVAWEKMVLGGVVEWVRLALTATATATGGS